MENSRVVNLGEKNLDFTKKPLLMGIVNMTPDSFSDGGRYNDRQKSMFRIDSLLRNGADIIDIGGESTRPGSFGVSAEQELERVIPVIESASREFDTVISVDTTKAVVAQEALGRGASIVNDISGLGFEPEIAEKVSERNAGIILMHTPSRPNDMQRRNSYTSLVDDIKQSLLDSVGTALAAGVQRNRIMIDPGIGFGKNTAQNIEIIRKLEQFCNLGFAVCIGTSRKSFIGEILQIPRTDGRLIGSVCSAVLSMLKGVSIMRVHDVLETAQAVRMVKAVYGTDSGEMV